jgi:hypothetical protein
MFHARFKSSRISNIRTSMTAENGTCVHMVFVTGNDFRNKVLKYYRKTQSTLHKALISPVLQKSIESKWRKVQKRQTKNRSPQCVLKIVSDDVDPYTPSERNVNVTKISSFFFEKVSNPYFSQRKASVFIRMRIKRHSFLEQNNHSTA